MEEDEEYFYDSLDEEPPHQSLSLKKGNSNNTIQQASKLSIFEECLDTLSVKSKTNNNITKIPLYIGEVNRDEIKYLVKKNTASNSIITSSKKSISCLSTNSNLSNKQFNAAQKEKPNKSYWHMYCQKNNISLEDDLNDSARSLFGESTSRTFPSFLSSCGLNGPTWDAPSVFEKYMPKSYGLQLNDTLGNDEVLSNPSSSDITLFDSLKQDDVFRSVSQIQLPTNQNVEINIPSSSKQSRVAQKSFSNTTNKNCWNSKLNKNKSYTSTSSSKRVLSLKDIGPDESKISLLKKQQEYGIKASNRNRAKMLQSKIAKNIKENAKMN